MALQIRVNNDWWWCRPCKLKIVDKTEPCPKCNAFKAGVSVAARRKCVVCLDAEPVALLLPCRHLCLCSPCGAGVIAAAAASCPVCRAPITEGITVFHV